MRQFGGGTSRGCRADLRRGRQWGRQSLATFVFFFTHAVQSDGKAVANHTEIRNANAKANAHSDRLAQSILAKAFRGERVLQDPNDEPASVLLDRIRTERSNPPPRSGRPATARRQENLPAHG